MPFDVHSCRSCWLMLLTRMTMNRSCSPRAYQANKIVVVVVAESLNWLTMRYLIGSLIMTKTWIAVTFPLTPTFSSSVYAVAGPQARTEARQKIPERNQFWEYISMMNDEKFLFRLMTMMIIEIFLLVLFLLHCVLLQISLASFFFFPIDIIFFWCSYERREIKKFFTNFLPRSLYLRMTWCILSFYFIRPHSKCS